MFFKHLIPERGKILIFLTIFLCNLSAEIFNGMTLYTPIVNETDTHQTFLIDNQMTIINTWSHERGVASMPYLLEDSTLLYPYRVENPSMNTAGAGGGISKYSWDGELLWDYIIANESYQHHHDIEPLPNGNILIIVWERKSAQEAFAVGRQTINNPLNQMWSEAILELEPVGDNDANIVWKWHLWDHLIQDVDPSLPNYGIIANHPELQDINYENSEIGPTNTRPGGPNGDWKHFNAIDYNQELDQIVISSRAHDEIYIIDHSTTTEEAKNHAGGNSGMGGDFLYRWGNPNAYGRGTDSNHILKDPHGVNWIESGYPGFGNIIIFNNNHTNNSAVIEIITPINDNGIYFLENNMAYEPEEPAWIYLEDFHSEMQGGAFRLPNGNTLITDCDDGYIFEVTQDHSIVWEHNYNEGENIIARAQKYSMGYLNNDSLAFMIGDVNYDRLINLTDILIIIDISIGHGYTYNLQADFNFDGIVNMDDVLSLLEFVLMN